eukprot:GHVL01001092.1.p1 GENE.GHVL01001092.1~~GHVL01001092.1.p1  ORF type:complete len:330 (-),score=16.41 GHVL01001092.1:501-1490(-)
MLSGRKETSDRKERIRLSIAQDICYAVSTNECKMPKHIVLATAVRHLTGSAELLSMLNRFGHCISHGGVLQIETAACHQIMQNSSLLPTTIRPENNVMTHFCWDNFDLQEETVSGSGTTHSAHGIVIQEVSESVPPTGDARPEQSRDSVEFSPEDLPPCYAKQKVEPKLTLVDTTISVSEVVTHASLSDFLLILARRKCANDPHIPEWAGWISLTGREVQAIQEQSVVDYMPPVLHPVTDNATVRHILHLAQCATKEVDQECTLATFDLAVAKKACMIVWKDQRINNGVVRLGVFHLICSFLGALGKLMRGSGLEEIVMEYAQVAPLRQ